jgi:hypothetical protein
MKARFKRHGPDVFLILAIALFLTALAGFQFYSG